MVLSPHLVSVESLDSRKGPKRIHVALHREGPSRVSADLFRNRVLSRCRTLLDRPLLSAQEESIIKTGSTPIPWETPLGRLKFRPWSQTLVCAPLKRCSFLLEGRDWTSLSCWSAILRSPGMGRSCQAQLAKALFIEGLA